MIQRHIAADATVTESAELVDRNTGQKREVDICIEANIAGHTVLVSLECSAPGRRATVEWVERMYGKHSTLPTNKLVLVSDSGFTKQAFTKAESLGVETIVPQELTEERAGEIAQHARMVLAKLDLQVETVRAWVAAMKSEPGETVSPLPDNNVFTQSHDMVAPMAGIVQALMQQTQRQFGELLFNSAENAERFEVISDSPQATIGDPPALQSLYMEKIEPSPHLRLITKILIQGSAKVTRSDIALQPSRFQGARYSWGSITFDGKPTTVVSSKGLDDTVVVSIRPLPGAKSTDVHTATATPVQAGNVDKEHGGDTK